jgi:large subunit ribosomal protein L5
MARLLDYYKTTVVPELTQKFGYKSRMEVPRITKVTLNMGVGEAVADKKVLENAIGDLVKIAGQKPVRPRPANRSPASRFAPAIRLAAW